MRLLDPTNGSPETPKQLALCQKTSCWLFGEKQDMPEVDPNEKVCKVLDLKTTSIGIKLEPCEASKHHYVCVLGV